jgi:hypothetical protein
MLSRVCEEPCLGSPGQVIEGGTTRSWFGKWPLKGLNQEEASRKKRPQRLRAMSVDRRKPSGSELNQNVLATVVEMIGARLR